MAPTKVRADRAVAPFQVFVDDTWRDIYEIRTDADQKQIRLYNLYGYIEWLCPAAAALTTRHIDTQETRADAVLLPCEIDGERFDTRGAGIDWFGNAYITFRGPGGEREFAPFQTVVWLPIPSVAP